MAMMWQMMTGEDMDDSPNSTQNDYFALNETRQVRNDHSTHFFFFFPLLTPKPRRTIFIKSLFIFIRSLFIKIYTFEKN
jgi:hypothetical protein